ncbi:MAG: hypothetical protein ACFE0O_14750 [Opitutales bacterium]
MEKRYIKILELLCFIFVYSGAYSAKLEVPLREETFISYSQFLYLNNFSKEHSSVWHIKINGVPLVVELSAEESFIIASHTKERDKLIHAKINSKTIESEIIQFGTRGPEDEVRFLLMNQSGNDTWGLKQKIEGSNESSGGFGLLLVDAEEILVELDRVVWPEKSSDSRTEDSQTGQT